MQDFPAGYRSIIAKETTRGCHPNRTVAGGCTAAKILGSSNGYCLTGVSQHCMLMGPSDVSRTGIIGMRAAT